LLVVVVVVVFFYCCLIFFVLSLTFSNKQSPSDKRDRLDMNKIIMKGLSHVNFLAESSWTSVQRTNKKYKFLPSNTTVKADIV